MTKTGRPCSICTHAYHDKIDDAILAGASKTELATKYKVTWQSLMRHEKDHMLTPRQYKEPERSPIRRAARRDSADPQNSVDIALELENLCLEAFDILEAAKAEGKAGMALDAIARATKTLEVLARVVGELKDVRINITVQPVWISLRQNIITALEPYPEARIAVARAIEEGESCLPTT